MSAEELLICGASARAAAFSALRAGLSPHCADLFADVDLRQRCPVTRLTGRYPDGFRSFLGSDLPGPWMYTGGLENRPRWVQRWSRRRPLWGNTGSTLRLARSPEHVTRILQRAGMPAPALYRPGEKKAGSTRWLVKPRQGAGGSGVRFFSVGMPEQPNIYYQEYIEGQSCSLVYLGDGRNARLLGMTRQLVGVSFLHAAPFRYCGSIGPIEPGTIQRPALIALGDLLVRECGLCGLFGVDGVVRENIFWPVEINPRYTASVEVLEYATGWQALAGHAHVFMRDRLPSERERRAPGDDCVGKAILFAPADVVFPADGPWMKELRTPTPLDALPGFADIPTAGERIEAGRPILTFYVRARTASACESALRQIALDLDHWLYQR
jgi:predicted ATP-grasp superfamily ATP-dependent carboligase